MNTAQSPSRGILGYVCGMIAGLVSGAILAFALAHSDSLLVLCAYLAAVPLFMAGLGAGVVASFIAAFCGTAGLLAFAPESFGVFYVVSYAVPAVTLVLFALRQPVTEGVAQQGRTEGSLLAAATLYPCIIFAGIFAATISHDGGLLAMTQTAFEGVADQATAMLSANGQEVTPELTLQVHHYLDLFARIAPALGMCAWLFSTLIAMGAAQLMLAQQKLNLRSSFTLMNLHIPSWVVFAAALTGLVASFAPTPYDYLGLNLALTLGVPFFFVGIAIIHAWAAQTKHPTVALVVFYVVISIIVHLVLLVALLGAIDQWVDFRKRFAEAPKMPK